MALLKLFTLLIFIALSLGELIRIEVSGTIALKPLDLLVGITVVIYFVLVLLKKAHFSTRYAKWIGLFALVGAISLILNSTWLQPSQMLVASLYLVRWVCYLLLLNVLMQFDTHSRQTLQRFLLLSGLIILTLGYLQYALYPDLRNLFYLGWDEHNLRMFSVFLDPNFVGAFFVFYFVFVGGLLLHNNGGKRTKKEISFLIATLILTLIAVFLTFSRSALLMLLTSSAVFLILIHRKKLLLLLVGITAVAILLMSPYFYVENMNLFRVASSKARLDTTIHALRIIQDRPLLGVGFNAYRYAQQSYGFRSEKQTITSHSDAGVDNSFLFILATTGIVGFFVYLMLWRTILRHAYKHKKQRYGAVVLASSAGLFVNAFFINSLFFPPLMLWLVCLVGIMEE